MVLIVQILCYLCLALATFCSVKAKPSKQKNLSPGLSDLFHYFYGKLWMLGVHIRYSVAGPSAAVYRILEIYSRLHGKTDGRVGMALFSIAHVKCAQGEVFSSSRRRDIWHWMTRLWRR
uniref:Secreted protein n=1 Tax=Opuntia streptacantha TaxID=393608 RepID=A0A7C9AC46_OPUST